MYVILKQRQAAAYYHEPKVHEIAKTLIVAKDRCRTLNSRASTNQYWFEKATPIIDASGTKANPKLISF